MTIIFKIEDQEIWQTATKAGVYEGSTHDKQDGFIHFSTSNQLVGTLNKHYANRINLLLIAIDSTTLGSDLKWEPSRDGALFPHLYAPLPTTHVLWEKPIEQNENGEHSLPSEAHNHN